MNELPIRRTSYFSLAIASDGALVFHQSPPAGSARLVSWNHDGTDRWSQATVGSDGYTAIGSQADERAYVVSNASPLLTTRATNIQTPTQTFSPLLTGLEDGTVSSVNPVLVSRSGEEVAYFVTRNGHFGVHAWRLSNQARLSVDGGELTGFTLSQPVTDNLRLFAPSNTTGSPTDLVVVSFAPNGMPNRVELPIAMPGGVVSAAVSQPDLVYLGVGVFLDAGVLLPVSSTGLVSPELQLPLRNPDLVIGENTIFFSDAFSSDLSCRLPLGSTSPTCVSRGTRGAGILGAPTAPNQPPVLYQQSGLQLLALDSSTLSVIWRSPDHAAPQSPVSIDCSRTAAGVGRTGVAGVLYTLPAIGELTATIIDSPGIDAMARWPMKAHDPRNSANSTSSLANFYCP